MSSAPSSSRREGSQQQRHTRTEILAAAAELASLEGLAQLSMGELASKVGLTKSGLYAHFESKEALQLAIIDYSGQVFEADVLRNPSGGPDDGLRALLERWLAFYERRIFPGACFFIVAAVEFAARTGPVPEALKLRVEQQITALETAIQCARAGGELRLPNDTSQTAFELHAILMNTHALFQLTNHPAVFDRARAAIARLVG